MEVQCKFISFFIIIMHMYQHLQYFHNLLQKNSDTEYILHVLYICVLGCIPWGEESVIQDHSDHGTSKEPMNLVTYSSVPLMNHDLSDL